MNKKLVEPLQAAVHHLDRHPRSWAAPHPVIDLLSNDADAPPRSVRGCDLGGVCGWAYRLVR